MGTHPIFESDFDCLTDLFGLMVHAENLYSAIGYEKLFAPSELLGKIGCRLSGHSSQKALFPLAWRLSSLGDERKAEMNLNPNLKDLYGNLHPLLDRTVNVGVTYNPATKTVSKDTWLSEHFALQNESVIGGNMIEAVKARAKGAFRFHPVELELDVLAPLDKTIVDDTSINFRLAAHNFFLASDVHSNNLKEPSVKVGYQDKDLSLILENTKRAHWMLEATKQADVNTIVGMKSNVLSGEVTVAAEHVTQNNSEVKLGLSNTDTFNLEYAKQFNHVTTTVAMQSTGLIKTGKPADIKFGFGFEIVI